MKTPAFPSAQAVAVAPGVTTPGHPGMSMRDYVAADVFGRMIKSIYADADPYRRFRDTARAESIPVQQMVARHAFEWAEAFIAEQAARDAKE